MILNTSTLRRHVTDHNVSGSIGFEELSPAGGGRDHTDPQLSRRQESPSFPQEALVEVDIVDSPRQPVETQSHMTKELPVSAFNTRLGRLGLAKLSTPMKGTSKVHPQLSHVIVLSRDTGTAESVRVGFRVGGEGELRFTSVSQRDIKYVGDEGSDVTAFCRTTEDLVVHHDPHPEFTESVPADDDSEDEWDKLLHDAGKTLEDKIGECRYDESYVYVRCSDPSCQKWRRIENVVYYALQQESDLTIDEWTCAEMGYPHAATGRPPPVTAHKGVPADAVALYTQVFDVPLSSQDDTSLGVLDARES